MTLRTKLLDIVELDIDRLGDEALLDLLIVAYKRRGDEIKKLEAANAQERERLRADREDLQIERRNLHNDPLYGAGGTYYWTDLRMPGEKLRYCVNVRGGHIEMFRRENNIDWAVMQVSPEEWSRK